jgi:D-3-phosphoglycerate dehydrogenase
MFFIPVTDHDFDSLDIEQEVLGDVADVRVLSAEPGDVAAEEDQFADADAVLNLRADLDRTTIEAIPECRIIARYGIGVDNVDVEAATQAGMYVTNVPTYCIEEVSTHALSLVLSALRNVPAYDQSVATGEWDREVGARFTGSPPGLSASSASVQSVAVSARKPPHWVQTYWRATRSLKRTTSRTRRPN